MDIHNVLLVRVSSSADDVDHPQFSDPCYPLKTIQAILEQYKNLRVYVRDNWIHPCSTKSLIEYARNINADVVVVSASSFDVQVANDFVTRLGDLRSAPLVVGIGHGMHLNHDMSNGQDTNYDAILLGESEEAFSVLFEQMCQDKSENAPWRKYYRDLYVAGTCLTVENLDSLPYPTYTAEELAAYRSIFPVRIGLNVKWGYLIASRGCPHACSFCSEAMRVSTGTKMRLRSGKSVADEMEHLVSQGANILSFQDDSFASSRKLVHDVCNELIHRHSRIPWMARVRCDEIDRDLLLLMKQAGCVILGIGVEAGTQRIIDNMHKTNSPEPWMDRARQTFRWTREIGIGTNAYYIIGNPTETRDEMEKTITLALELDSDSIQVHFYTPYPGSSDWKKYRDIITAYDPAKMFHYAKPPFTLADVSIDELMEIRGMFYRRYIFRPSFILRHLWNYGVFYLLNPHVFWSLLGIRRVITKGKNNASA